MSEATSGFFKGFFNKGAQVVGDRKAVAEDFYAKQVAAATQYAYGKKNKTTGAQTQVLGKLKAAGVPDDVLRSMINQDPDDLERIYDDVTKMQAEGVKEVGPEFWNTLNEAKTEVAPQRKYSEFIGENREGIVNNYKASGDGAGSIWSTLMGHNAMERASARLEDTMIGDKSAAEWLAESQQGDSYQFGSDLDYGAVGDALQKPNELDFEDRVLFQDRLKKTYEDSFENAKDTVPPEAKMKPGPDGKMISKEPAELNALYHWVAMADLETQMDAYGVPESEAERVRQAYNAPFQSQQTEMERPADVPDLPAREEEMVVGNRYWHPDYGVIRKRSDGEIERVK